MVMVITCHSRLLQIIIHLMFDEIVFLYKVVLWELFRIFANIIYVDDMKKYIFGMIAVAGIMLMVMNSSGLRDEKVEHLKELVHEWSPR